MEAKAKATYVRISPRKVQIVLDLIRNQPADKAMAILKFTHKAACEPVSKVLKSAIANAENNFNMDVSRLVVSEAHVAPGPVLRESSRELRAEHTESTKEHHTLPLFSRKWKTKRGGKVKWDRNVIQPV